MHPKVCVTTTSHDTGYRRRAETKKAIDFLIDVHVQISIDGFSNAVAPVSIHLGAEQIKLT